MDMLDKTAITIPNAIFFETVIEILALGKSAKFILKGHSMIPFLKDNDHIVLVQIDVSTLQYGQIVLAKYHDKYVLHRIVSIKDDEVWLAGDGNIAQIEIIPFKGLIASIHQVYRNEKEIIVTSRFHQLKGLIWYYCRPIRFIVKKIFG